MPEPALLTDPKVSTENRMFSVPEQQMMTRHMGLIRTAIQARNNAFHKFDGLNLIQDYYANEDAVNSYLRPKRNDAEVRVVSGATEKRFESLVNELAAFNTQHEIQAFDKDDLEVKSLGHVMEDTITRTNDLELDEDVRIDAIMEFCSQRAVFMEETWEDKYASGINMGMCKKRLRTVLEVALGDLSLPHYRLQDQPYVAVYDRLSYPSLARHFRNNKNWKYVRPGLNLDGDVYGPTSIFTLGKMNEWECEVIRFYSVPDDEYQVYVNGIPMQSVGSEIPMRKNGVPYYPLAMGVSKRMGAHFPYAKPPVATMKFLQAFSDETVRNIIRKFRQVIDPPRAVATSAKIYSRDIFEAGQTTYGVDAGIFKKLVEHNGVTQGEMTVLTMIREMQDELSSRSATQLGISQGPKRTATEIVEAQKQAVQMLGLLVINWNRFVRDFTYLRLYNVEAHIMSSSGKVYDPALGEIKDIYRSITLNEQTLPSGKRGKKIIQFGERDLTEEEGIGLMQEEDQAEKQGKPFRMTFVNVKAIKNSSIKWYVTTRSAPRESDDLHRLMFQDKLKQAAEISQFAQMPLNGQEIASEYEETWRTKNWFKKEQPAPAPGGQPPQQGEPAPQPTGGVGGDIVGAIKPEIPPVMKPSAREAVGALQE